MHHRNKAMPAVAGLQFLLQQVSLLCQGQFASRNMCQSFCGSRPNRAIWRGCNGSDIIVWKPALARKIGPLTSPPVDQSLGRAKPDSAIRSHDCCCQINYREALRARKCFPPGGAVTHIKSLICGDDEMALTDSCQSACIGAEQPAWTDFQIQPILALAHQTEKT